MRIAIEGPEMKSVDFDEILNVFKEKNRLISNVVIVIPLMLIEMIMNYYNYYYKFLGGGESHVPTPCMEPCYVGVY